ncbi:uncharacterized protein LOC135162680 [Diachasmimorpha longicaudata]|uniref:uncharacterized protein LOC135162680 n=1 Tax=Diachasmimorpha longicaudata TaxID=58733 RepID=UPI0030B89425
MERPMGQSQPLGNTGNMIRNNSADSSSSLKNNEMPTKKGQTCVPEMKNANEENQQVMVKIENLGIQNSSVTINVEVISVSPNGLKKIKNGRHCFAFTIRDETGTTTAIAWEEVAIPLSKVIAIGQSIKIINGYVEKAKNNPDQHLIILSQTSSVEIFKENKKVYLVTSEGCQSLLVRPAAELQVDEVQRKKICLSSGVQKIADLTAAQQCSCIKMEVMTMITNGIICSANGKQYLRFIGHDDTGEICCSIFEPHSRTTGHLIQVGVDLQLENIKVKPVNSSYTRVCNNDFEIVVYPESCIKILEDKTEETVAPTERPSELMDQALTSQPIKNPVVEPMEVTSTSPSDAKVSSAAEDSSTCAQREKIIELNSQRQCESIELKVSQLVTNGVAVSHGGMKYVRFIGTDDTGEICCSIFEPLSVSLGHLVQVGLSVQVGNVKVKAVNAAYPKVCNNDFEIVLYRGSRMKILEPEPGEIIAAPGMPPEQEDKQTAAECIEDPVVEPQEVIPKEPSDTNTASTAADLSSGAQKFKVNELTVDVPCKCIELKILTMITDGIPLSRGGTTYLRFIGADDTGEIACTVFEPHSIEAGPHLRSGAYVLLEQPLVQPVNINFAIWCKNSLEIHVSRNSSIKVLKQELNDMPTTNGTPPMDEDQQGYPLPVEQPMIKMLKQEEVADTTILAQISKTPIIGDNFQITECIELEVKCFLFPGVHTDSKNRSYIIFIGAGTLGEICCSVFNPDRIIEDIEVGSCVKLLDAQIKTVDPRLPRFCDNDFEILVDGGNNIQILSKFSRVRDVVRLGALANVKNQEPYAFVDVLTVLCELENEDMYPFSPLPKIIVADEDGGIEVPIIFPSASFVDPSLRVNTVISCRNLQVRISQGNYELHFVPEKSAIVVHDVKKLRKSGRKA